MNRVDQKQSEEKKRKSKLILDPRAQKFSKLVKKGRNNTVKFRAFRSTPKFRRLRRSLLTIARNPRYARKSVQRENTFDRFSILISPCTSERFYKKMETENTIIFYVDARSNKQQIKSAFEQAFGCKPERVNTLNTVGGRKKAYIKVPRTTEASEIANKIGLI
jgi:large subunit ribosomal protein L23Ae